MQLIYSVYQVQSCVPLFGKSLKGGILHWDIGQHEGKGEAPRSPSGGNVRNHRIFSKSILRGALCSFCGVEVGTVVLPVMLCLKQLVPCCLLWSLLPPCLREKCFDL